MHTIKATTLVFEQNEQLYTKVLMEDDGTGFTIDVVNSSLPELRPSECTMEWLKEYYKKFFGSDKIEEMLKGIKLVEVEVKIL